MAKAKKDKDEVKVTEEHALGTAAEGDIENPGPPDVPLLEADKK